MIAAFALCALVQGGESMQLACAQRDLRGKELARLELLTQLAAMVVIVNFVVDVMYAVIDPRVKASEI